MAGLRGVYNILATPFQSDESLDEPSLKRLVRATVEAGVDGITILGVAGEAQKLIAAERERVQQLVIEEVGGAVPVFVGASQDGTAATIAAARSAAKAGAKGLMVAPPTFLQPGPQLTEHYRRLASTVDLPIVLQDYPPVNGVTMSARQMADLCQAVPAITTVKLEGTPTPQRTAQTLAAAPEGVTVLGGLGGMYLLDELRRGASGTMTGFAFPEVLIRIWKAWEAGDRERAAEVYERHLPLLVFEGQPGIGLAIRKEILRRRGLIEQATVRHPGPQVDPGVLADLEEVLDRLQLTGSAA
jgi:4-hydroxy-tetrahydrodipicolinate synthase